jgi:hypothetical protein
MTRSSHNDVYSCRRREHYSIPSVVPSYEGEAGQGNTMKIGKLTGGIMCGGGRFGAIFAYYSGYGQGVF